MEFTEYIRKPFVIEAVKVTEENIAEIAEFVGTLKTLKDGVVYIQADQRFGSKIFRIFPGYWVTLMGDNVRFYSQQIFDEQFTEITPEVKQWVDFLARGKNDEAAAAS